MSLWRSRAASLPVLDSRVGRPNSRQQHLGEQQTVDIMNKMSDFPARYIMSLTVQEPVDGHLWTVTTTSGCRWTWVPESRSVPSQHRVDTAVLTGWRATACFTVTQEGTGSRITRTATFGWVRVCGCVCVFTLFSILILLVYYLECKMH